MNIPANFWKTVMGAFGLLTIFLIIISIKELKAIGYVGVNPNMTNSITVDGTGDAVAIPDVATFSFTVKSTAKVVATAQSQATDKVNTALKAVRDAGVADKDIQTLSYTINPHYEYHSAVCPTPVAGSQATVYCPSGKQVLTGYDVSQTIGVKVRNTAKAGDIFTTIGSLGVESVDSLQFSVDQPDSVQAEARAKAIAKAQAKANELAKQLGVKLVRVTSFYESNQSYPIAYGRGGSDKVMMSAAVAAPSPEIPTGEQKITDNVTITYEIK